MARSEIEVLAELSEPGSSMNMPPRSDWGSAAAALLAKGEVRLYAGKRDVTFTYAITKKGRARLAAILVAPLVAAARQIIAEQPA